MITHSSVDFQGTPPHHSAEGKKKHNFFPLPGLPVRKRNASGSRTFGPVHQDQCGCALVVSPPRRTHSLAQAQSKAFPRKYPQWQGMVHLPQTGTMGFDPQPLRSTKALQWRGRKGTTGRKGCANIPSCPRRFQKVTALFHLNLSWWLGFVVWGVESMAVDMEHLSCTTKPPGSKPPDSREADRSGPKSKSPPATLWRCRCSLAVASK